MQYKLYQNRQGNKDLILFFNGWAMTPETVEHLSFDASQDVALVWDYRSLDLDLDLTAYRSVKVFAWSMGVWAADKWYTALEEKPTITEAVAVCGTGYPMSDEGGIPQAIFEGTLEGVSEENRTRFNRRMCGGKSLRHLFDALAKRPTEEIKEELQNVYNEEVKRLSLGEVPKQDVLPWTRAIIGGKDRIIPAENQKRYWEELGLEPNILEDEAHYIFSSFASWEELLQKHSEN